jgi:hypothetical protein
VCAPVVAPASIQKKSRNIFHELLLRRVRHENKKQKYTEHVERIKYVFLLRVYVCFVLSYSDNMLGMWCMKIISG